MTTSDIRQLPQSIHNQLLSLRETGLMMDWGDILRSCTDWHSSGTHPTSGSTSPSLVSVVQHQNIDENPDVHIAGMHAKLHWYENPDAVPAVPLGVVSYPVEEGSKLKLKIQGLSSSQFITEQMAARLVGYLCEIVKIFVSQRADENEEVVAWECFYASVRADFGVDFPRTSF